MEISQPSDSDDSLVDFQSNIERAISGLEDIKKFRSSIGAARSSRHTSKKKRGPKLTVVSNKWYHLPAGSPVPNFKAGQELLSAHRREGYGFPASHLGENGEGMPVAMHIDMTTEQFQRKAHELFPNLRGEFQCFKLNRQKQLVPLEPNHPSALCPTKSTSRFCGIVFIKEKSVNEEVLVSDREQDDRSREATSFNYSEPSSNMYTYEGAGTPSVTFRRQLIRQQDEEFQESLRVDRERDEILQAQADHERRRQLAIERRRSNLIDEPASGSQIRIRFPNGDSVRRRFDPSESIQVIFNYIGAKPEASEKFTIHLEGQNLDSSVTGTCESHGLRDRMSIFVSWHNDQETLNTYSNAVPNQPPSPDLSSHLSTSSVESVHNAVEETVIGSERDWKLVLKMIQTQISSDDAPTGNCINVTRDGIISGAKRGFNRKSFNPFKKISIAFVDEGDVGEGAVDNGGPTREFFRLLLREAVESYIFKGPQDGRHLALSTQALAKNTYRDVGKFIALSLIHGGPGPRCLSKVLYWKLAGYKEFCQCSITDICDDNIETKLKQILAATTMEVVTEELQKNEELLLVLGSVRHVQTLQERDELVKSAVNYYVFGRLQLAIEQFMEGLSTGGILELIQNHPNGAQHLFVKGDDELTSSGMQDLFDPVLSLAGSNKRMCENRIISYWRDWLIDIADGESQVTLGQLLAFVSGADVIPPLGFTMTPTLEFLHDGGSFPTANTCALVLRLPILPSYEEWTEKMESGIIQSPVFGQS